MTKLQVNKGQMGEKGTLGINQSLVPVFLRKFDTSKPLPKKAHELLVAYVFASFLESQLRETAVIGFPAKDGWNSGFPERELTLDYLIEHPDKFVKDSDADIHISAGCLVTKYQITRFVFPTEKGMYRNLSQLIAKKCMTQQTDRKLHLVVSIEKNPSVTMQEFQTHLHGLRVPYGAIFLIQKASEKAGHFRLIQLFPKLRILKEIFTELPV